MSGMIKTTDMDKVYKGNYFKFVFKTPKEELDKRFTLMVQEFYNNYYL